MLIINTKFRKVVISGGERERRRGRKLRGREPFSNNLFLKLGGACLIGTKRAWKITPKTTFSFCHCPFKPALDCSPALPLGIFDFWWPCVEELSCPLGIQWYTPSFFQSCSSGSLSLPTGLPALRLSSLWHFLHISISVSDCATFLFRIWGCFLLYNIVRTF